MKWKITCLQMDIAFGKPEENFKTANDFIHKYKNNADVLVLPELWTTGYDLTRLEEIGDRDGQTFRKTMSETASEINKHLIAGSTAVIRENGVTNTLYAYDKSGDEILEYSKGHLFKLMDEHHHLISGEADGLFTLDGVTCAGLICYDIRFPEWVRAHAAKGAEVIFVVAEWPLARVDHWRALLRARAIENQCYIVACNRIGDDPNNTFAGHSVIIDPWGDVLAEGNEQDEAISAEIDIDEVKKVRKKIPIFTDRRTGLYEKLEKRS
ncbi:carbon-nitrogen family hydrolase [Bacillus tianshenii]|nr:carbon-nitrogen family hydrolase [Bacillus tianshenii]